MIDDRDTAHERIKRALESYPPRLSELAILAYDDAVRARASEIDAFAAGLKAHLRAHPAWPDRMDLDAAIDAFAAEFQKRS
jgi:predicted component of type VI protein secretion system